MSLDDADAEVVRRMELYLLGRLRGAERRRMEAGLFADQRIFDRLREAEEQLIERYIEGALSGRDRDDFERCFAVTRERRERIAFQRALPGALARESDAGTRAPTRRWSARPVWLGFAATAATLLTGMWGAGLLSPSRWPGPTGSPVQPDIPSPSVAPSAAERGAPPPSPPTVVLRGGLSRGAGDMPRVHIPRGARAVRLRAVLTTVGAAGTLTAILRSVEGEDVWRGAAVWLADGRQAEVVLPSAILRPGDYVLSLASADQQGEEEYVFRVPVTTGR